MKIVHLLRIAGLNLLYAKSSSSSMSLEWTPVSDGPNSIGVGRLLPSALGGLTMPNETLSEPNPWIVEVGDLT